VRWHPWRRKPAPTPDPQSVGQHKHPVRLQLYIRYRRKLACFLTRLQSHEAAEKIIDDTLWVVWTRADSFNDASRVSTWILGIAYRRSLESPRRAARRERAVRLDISEGKAIAHGRR